MDYLEDIFQSISSEATHAFNRQQFSMLLSRMCTAHQMRIKESFGRNNKEITLFFWRILRDPASSKSEIWKANGKPKDHVKWCAEENWVDIDQQS